MKTTATAMKVFQVAVLVAGVALAFAARPAPATLVVDAPAIVVELPTDTSTAVFVDAPAIEVRAKGAAKPFADATAAQAVLTEVGGETVAYYDAPAILVPAAQQADQRVAALCCECKNQGC
jgi:hypothetical protein